MEREIHWRAFGETVVHPLSLVFTLAMGIWLLRVRRDRAVLPVMLVACLIPVAQRIVIATFDFDMSRLLILFGWARILSTGEFRTIRWCRLDTAFVAHSAAALLTYVARERSVGALVYQLGLAFEACGIYFLLRALLHTSTDVLRSCLNMAGIAVVVGASMLVENLTGRNFFSVFGGVHEFTVVRDGRLRCQGAFSHPIMAGSFGASVAPIAGMIAAGLPLKSWLAWAGLLGALVVVVTSSSSGPALAVLTAVLGCAMFPLRNRMRLFRYGLAAVLTVIHLVREAPVWHLIGRASDLVGGTGYHRVRLISAFVENWRDWFWFGTSSTAGWGWGLQDLTNQFVYEGVQGGMPTLVSLIVLLSFLFGAIGTTVHRAQAARHLPRPVRLRLQMLAWGLGVALATHCVSWISVSYFGQMTLILYALFALIVALYQTPELARPRVRSATPDAAAATATSREEPREDRARAPRLTDLL